MKIDRTDTDCATDTSGKTVSVTIALERVRTGAPRMDVQAAPLSRAHDRILAKPVTATRDQPPFPASAMDGYAVADGPGPFTLIGESVAGRRFRGAVSTAEAVRIFTGGVIPPGATRIIMQEHIRPDGDRLYWLGSDADKRNIRPQGQDFRSGDVVLRAGSRLTPGALAVAAATGHATVSVRRRPQVAILCTGNELAAPGQPAHDDQIFEAMSPAIAGLVTQWGGRSRFLGIASDTPESIAETLQSVTADLIVIIGGASKGDYDCVKSGLATRGITLAFSSVHMKPGKPVWFGHLSDGTAVLGLPGNPSAAFVAAHLFLKAIIERALDLPETMPAAARLTCDLAANGRRETFLLANIHDGQVTPLAAQDSSLVSSLVRSNALIHRLPYAAEQTQGQVTAMILSDSHNT